MWSIKLIVLKQTESFVTSPGEPAYPREMLLRLVLMSVFDGDYPLVKLKGEQELTLLICT